MDSAGDVQGVQAPQDLTWEQSSVLLLVLLIWLSQGLNVFATQLHTMTPRLINASFVLQSILFVSLAATTPLSLKETATHVPQERLLQRTKENVKEERLFVETLS